MNKNFENGIIKSIPKKWTKEEINKLLELKKQGIKNSDIARILGRTTVSINIKLKRLKKKDGNYNEKHREEKYKTNEKFLKIINPKSILDPYAGNKFYSNYSKKNNIKYITNDIDKKFDTDYNMDAFKFISQFDGSRFDLVDLDPFGSAFDLFDVAIRIADKGLVITLGELGHRRFKRIDFVKDRYDITKEDDNNKWTEKIIKYIQKRGKIYKKNLKPIFIKDWGNIGRLYFIVERFKETSQWENINTKNKKEIKEEKLF